MYTKQNNTMSELKNIALSVILIGLAFALPDILTRFDLVLQDSVQLIIQIGVVIYGVYFLMQGDRYE